MTFKDLSRAFKMLTIVYINEFLLNFNSLTYDHNRFRLQKRTTSIADSISDR